MGLIGFSAKILARLTRKRIDSWRRNAIAMQEDLFNKLIKTGRDTEFGRDHNFRHIGDYEKFKRQVPVRDYEALKSYIGRVRLGEKNVLWPGRPIYFAVTSGTTSGGKYIPITRESMPNHINSTRTALLNYINVTGKAAFLGGKYIFLSGSPRLEQENGIPTGRLSGIVNHHVPGYLKRNQLPAWDVNCIEDWDKKLDAIVDQTIGMNMTLISGIPPWVKMYFEKLIERSGKSTVREIFPGFELFVFGGVNFKPYEQKFKQLVGGDVDLLETFPASEGFIAFQDRFPGEGLILIPDAGIFYEFIPLDRFYESDPERLPLAGVQTGVNYVMILNTNAGLWGYNIGDTVRFISRDPYIIKVTGRISQYTSAFGEHVISEEVEWAIHQACKNSGARLTEFTVAPLFDNPNGNPCHEWFIEFSAPPGSPEEFGRNLDNLMRERNSYYNDLVKGSIIDPLLIRSMPAGSFDRYMHSIGRLGGQNKVPRLRNDREVADILTTYLQGPV